MGIGDHFRQPPPSIGAIRLLRAEAASGDQQISGACESRSRDLFQPLENIES